MKKELVVNLMKFIAMEKHFCLDQKLLIFFANYGQNLRPFQP